MANVEPPIPLEDILLSAKQGFWPLAPGWWFLIVVSIFLIGWGFYWLLKKHRQMAFLKQQQKQLDFLEKQFRNKAVISLEVLRTLNRILKLTLVNYSKQTMVTGLSGKDLARWLEQYLPIPKKLSPLFNDSIFQQQSEENNQMDKSELLPLLREYRSYQKNLVSILLKQPGEFS